MKQPTLYTQSTATKWTLNTTLYTLNSTVIFLNGYLTATVPNQASNKLGTLFANVVKNATAFTTNALNETGVRANSITVQANSTTVRATGYTGSVPEANVSRIPTAWSAA